MWRAAADGARGRRPSASRSFQLYRGAFTGSGHAAVIQTRGLEAFAECLDDVRVKLRAGHAPQLGDRIGGVFAATVGPVRGHRVEGIANRDDPGPHWNFLAGPVVGVT